MTHRERIRAAFACRPVDRVPIFDQTVFSNVASAATGRQLDIGGGELRYKETLALWQGEAAHREFVEKLLQDLAWFCRAMDYDMIRMPWRQTAKPTERIDEYTFLFGDRDDKWSVCRYDPESMNFHEVDNYLRHDGVDRLLEELRCQVRQYQGPRPPSEADFAEWDRLCDLAGPDVVRTCGYGGVGISMYEPAWLEAIYLEPDLLGEWHDQRCDQQIACIEVAHRHGAEVCVAGGDFCYNTGPAYSPELFRRIVLPGLSRIVEKCNELGMYYIFRTDGDTWKVASMLFEQAGCHGYGEIDYQAGMRLKDLREAFGRLCLFGNVDCAGVLVSGSAGEVRDATIENLTETGGIGHVLGSSNSVVGATPPENYLAMIETAKAWRP